MMLLVRIEMRTSRSESRPLTLGDLVYVYGTFSGRKVLQVERDRNAGAALVFSNRGGAHVLAFRISQFHHDRSIRGAHGGGTDESDNGTNNTDFGHVVLLRPQCSHKFVL